MHPWYSSMLVHRSIRSDQIGQSMEQVGILIVLLVSKSAFAYRSSSRKRRRQSWTAHLYRAHRRTWWLVVSYSTGVAYHCVHSHFSKTLAALEHQTATRSAPSPSFDKEGADSSSMAGISFQFARSFGVPLRASSLNTVTASGLSSQISTMISSMDSV